MQYRVLMDFKDGRGANVIQEWLQTLPVATRMDFQSKLRYLEQMQQPPRNLLKKLAYGDCAGLWEVRLDRENVEYRVLSFQGPGRAQLTMLLVATERDGKFVPRTACRTAKQSMSIARHNVRRVCEHDWSA
jgi:hypothetical protein